MARAMTIGQLAAAAGVQISTVRFYERSGLLSCPARSPGGHRNYTADELQRVMFIRHARELGFSIEQVREVLGLSTNEPQNCQKVKHIAEEHLRGIRQQIDALSRKARLLSDLVARCDADGRVGCPILTELRIGSSCSPAPSH